MQLAYSRLQKERAAEVAGELAAAAFFRCWNCSDAGIAVFRLLERGLHRWFTVAKKNKTAVAAAAAKRKQQAFHRMTPLFSA